MVYTTATAVPRSYSETYHPGDKSVEVKHELTDGETPPVPITRLQTDGRTDLVLATPLRGL